MRCPVMSGTNDAPIVYDLSPATMSIKLVLLS